MNRLFLAAALTAAMLAPAVALDLTKEIVRLDGKPFEDQAGKPVQTTIGDILQKSLVGQYPDEMGAGGAPPLSGEEKFKRWQLAARISGAKSIDLSAEETALLKKLVGKAYAVEVVGPAFILLDPAVDPAKKP